jgi:hypothetical protein
MKELAILGVVISYILLIVSQHLLNWGYRKKHIDLPLMILGQIFSLSLFYGLTMKVIETF